MKLRTAELTVEKIESTYMIQIKHICLLSNITPSFPKILLVILCTKKRLVIQKICHLFSVRKSRQRFHLSNLSEIWLKIGNSYIADNESIHAI